MKLHVVLLDTHRTAMSIQHENQYVPYRRRLVTIELTPEQTAKLEPRVVGSAHGCAMYEDVGEVWLEKEAKR